MGCDAVRVVVVEDHALLREGIVALLAENGIEVVAQATDGPGLLRIVDGHQPDLAICDVRLAPSFTDEGIRAALEARHRHPQLAILVLSQYVEPVYTGELLASGEGGVGYLLKERVSDVRTFIDSVKRVAAGGTALDREVVNALIANRDRTEPTTSWRRLPPASTRRSSSSPRAGPTRRSRASWWSRSVPSRSMSRTSSPS